MPTINFRSRARTLNTSESTTVGEPKDALAADAQKNNETPKEFNEAKKVTSDSSLALEDISGLTRLDDIETMALGERSMSTMDEDLTHITKIESENISAVEEGQVQKAAEQPAGDHVSLDEASELIPLPPIEDIAKLPSSGLAENGADMGGQESAVKKIDSEDLAIDGDNQRLLEGGGETTAVNSPRLTLEDQHVSESESDVFSKEEISLEPLLATDHTTLDASSNDLLEGHGSSFEETYPNTQVPVSSENEDGEDTEKDDVVNTAHEILPIEAKVNRNSLETDSEQSVPDLSLAGKVEEGSATEISKENSHNPPQLEQDHSREDATNGAPELQGESSDVLQHFGSDHGQVSDDSMHSILQNTVSETADNDAILKSDQSVEEPMETPQHDLDGSTVSFTGNVNDQALVLTPEFGSKQITTIDHAHSPVEQESFNQNLTSIDSSGYKTNPDESEAQQAEHELSKLHEPILLNEDRQNEQASSVEAGVAGNENSDVLENMANGDHVKENLSLLSHNEEIPDVSDPEEQQPEMPLASEEPCLITISDLHNQNSIPESAPGERDIGDESEHRKLDQVIETPTVPGHLKFSLRKAELEKSANEDHQLAEERSNRDRDQEVAPYTVPGHLKFRPEVLTDQAASPDGAAQDLGQYEEGITRESVEENESSIEDRHADIETSAEKTPTNIAKDIESSNALGEMYHTETMPASAGDGSAIAKEIDKVDNPEIPSSETVDDMPVEKEPSEPATPVHVSTEHGDSDPLDDMISHYTGEVHEGHSMESPTATVGFHRHEDEGEGDVHEDEDSTSKDMSLGQTLSEDSETQDGAENDVNVDHVYEEEAFEPKDLDVELEDRNIEPAHLDESDSTMKIENEESSRSVIEDGDDNMETHMEAPFERRALDSSSDQVVEQTQPYESEIGMNTGHEAAPHEAAPQAVSDGEDDGMEVSFEPRDLDIEMAASKKASTPISESSVEVQATNDNIEDHSETPELETDAKPSDTASSAVEGPSSSPEMERSEIPPTFEKDVAGELEEEESPAPVVNKTTSGLFSSFVSAVRGDIPFIKQLSATPPKTNSTVEDENKSLQDPQVTEDIGLNHDAPEAVQSQTRMLLDDSSDEDDDDEVEDSQAEATGIEDAADGKTGLVQQRNQINGHQTMGENETGSSNVANGDETEGLSDIHNRYSTASSLPQEDAGMETPSTPPRTDPSFLGRTRTGKNSSLLFLLYLGCE